MGNSFSKTAGTIIYFCMTLLFSGCQATDNRTSLQCRDAFEKSLSILMAPQKMPDVQGVGYDADKRRQVIASLLNMAHDIENKGDASWVFLEEFEVEHSGYFYHSELLATWDAPKDHPAAKCLRDLGAKYVPKEQWSMLKSLLGKATRIPVIRIIPDNPYEAGRDSFSFVSWFDGKRWRCSDTTFSSRITKFDQTELASLMPLCRLAAFITIEITGPVIFAKPTEIFWSSGEHYPDGYGTTSTKSGLK